MELKIFEKSEFGSVRVVMKDGEPWFVASDVAKALGYEKNCFENHISELFVEFKETLGLDLSTYDPTDLNAFMSQNSLLYISNFGLELLFEYLYDRDYQHLNRMEKMNERHITLTTKVTGRGQIYFVNRFVGADTPC